MHNTNDIQLDLMSAPTVSENSSGETVSVTASEENPKLYHRTRVLNEMPHSFDEVPLHKSSRNNSTTGLESCNNSGSEKTSHIFAYDRSLPQLIVKQTGVILIFASIYLLLYVILKFSGIVKENKH